MVLAFAATSLVCILFSHAPRLQHKFLAFRYFVTDGSKFGADYLLYPGDPLLYHAQFTVRLLEHQAAIRPALLIGAARGSHSARKHLLLASVGSMARPWYINSWVNVADGLGAAVFSNSVFLTSITSEAGFWVMQCGDMLCRSGQQPCHTSPSHLKVDLDRLDDIQLAKHS